MPYKNPQDRIAWRNRNAWRQAEYNRRHRIRNPVPESILAERKANRERIAESLRLEARQRRINDAEIRSRARIRYLMGYFNRRDREERKRTRADRKRAWTRRWSKKNKDRLLEYGRINRAINQRENPEKYRQIYFRSRLKRKYGMTVEQFYTLLEIQGGKCTICRDKIDLIKRNAFGVDHCNVVGHVRSILCTRCNSAIAMLRHSVRIATRAVAYLQKEILFNGE